MNALLFAAPVASLLVLGAHFLREGSLVLTGACGALVLLLAWRRAWVPQVLQAALALGAAEWAWTTFQLVQQRLAEGRPWGRMAIILAAVTLATAASILAVRRLSSRYARGSRAAST